MLNLTTIFAVAVAGALGAVSRLTFTQLLGLWLGRGYPWGTLFVNLLGSLLIGYLFGLWSNSTSEPSATIRAAVIVGFLGAFTTMSSFSLDSWEMLQRGEWIKAVSYISITFLGSLAAVGLGIFITTKN